MSPLTNPNDNRYALLASGANLSCEVLEALIQRQRPPSLLVLPEYPPAQVDRHELVESGTPRRLLQLAAGVEVAYAPAEHQAELGRIVERLQLQFIVVTCWPYLIAPQVIDSPACATLNLHPSLLPAWRGADPLTQQLAAGDLRFGVSLHLLDQEFDHGAIVAQAALPNQPAGPGRQAIERECARLGVDLLLKAMADFPHWQPVRQ